MKKLWILFTLLCLLCASACNLGESDTTDAVSTSDVASAVESEETSDETTTSTVIISTETTVEESTTAVATTAPETTVEETTTEPETTVEETTTEPETTVDATTTEPETTAVEDDLHAKNYSSVVVSSGENSVNPLQFFWASGGYVDGKQVSCDMGAGVYYEFKSPDFDASSIPVLTYDGNVTATAPENVIIQIKGEIYDTSYNELKILKSLDELSYLGEGAYIIVIRELVYTYSETTPNAYVETVNELVFKLVVPANSQYGSVTLSAGGKQIKPLAFMIFLNEYVDGENFLCADGWGANHFFENPPVYQSCLPTLQIGDGLSISCPSGTTSTTRGSVYNMAYNKVRTFEGLDELSALGSGEYIINLTELVNTRTDENDGDYSITCNDLIFKLIVP